MGSSHRKNPGKEGWKGKPYLKTVYRKGEDDGDLSKNKNTQTLSAIVNIDELLKNSELGIRNPETKFYFHTIVEHSLKMALSDAKVTNTGVFIPLYEEKDQYITNDIKERSAEHFKKLSKKFESDTAENFSKKIIKGYNSIALTLGDEDNKPNGKPAFTACFTKAVATAASFYKNLIKAICDKEPAYEDAFKDLNSKHR